jgi:hypothetical protein
MHQRKRGDQTGYQKHVLVSPGRDTEDFNTAPDAKGRHHVEGKKS